MATCFRPEIIFFSEGLCPCTSADGLSIRKNSAVSSNSGFPWNLIERVFLSFLSLILSGAGPIKLQTFRVIRPDQSAELHRSA